MSANTKHPVRPRVSLTQKTDPDPPDEGPQQPSRRSCSTSRFCLSAGTVLIHTENRRFRSWSMSWFLSWFLVLVPGPAAAKPHRASSTGTGAAARRTRRPKHAEPIRSERFRPSPSRPGPTCHPGDAVRQRHASSAAARRAPRARRRRRGKCRHHLHHIFLQSSKRD